MIGAASCRSIAIASAGRIDHNGRAMVSRLGGRGSAFGVSSG